MNDARPLLLVCALRVELAAYDVSEDVEILACGIGPVEAAIRTADALARRHYRAVVNAGIAGAYDGAASIGDAVVVAHERLADLGLETDEPLVLPAGARLDDRVDADAVLVARCRETGLRAVTGLTVSSITATDATGARRRDRYAAAVESMEGFAVLRAAALASVPAIEIRGISNLARDRTRSGWNFGAGAQALGEALRTVVPRLVHEGVS